MHFTSASEFGEIYLHRGKKLHVKPHGITELLFVIVLVISK